SRRGFLGDGRLRWRGLLLRLRGALVEAQLRHLLHEHGMAGEAHAAFAERLLGVVHEPERDVRIHLLEQPDEVDGDPARRGRGRGWGRRRLLRRRRGRGRGRLLVEGELVRAEADLFFRRRRRGQLVEPEWDLLLLRDGRSGSGRGGLVVDELRRDVAPGRQLLVQVQTGFFRRRGLHGLGGRYILLHAEGDLLLLLGRGGERDPRFAQR